MTDRLFGMETEYAVTGVTSDGRTVDRQHLVQLFQESVAESFTSAPDFYGSGVFLQNGGRFYTDCGHHPELATPECVEPCDAVRYLLAGDRILLILAEHVRSRLPSGTRVDVFRGNVDYSGSGATWGCHESFLHRVHPTELSAQLIPHLVTRIVYAGGGGFNPFSSGLEFTLSPRVHHLVQPISGNSTQSRGIFHTKDEPLCDGGYHRLHVLCGESCCSQLATWLKIGTTALVVAVIEAGLAPGRDVELLSPVDAIRTVAMDPECLASIPLRRGPAMRAIDIQRHYLRHVETHLTDGFLPAWAERVCCEWRATLNRLEARSGGLATELDWAIKRTLYAQHARRRGFAWESIARWTGAITMLRSALQQDQIHVPLHPEALLSWNSPARSHAQSMDAALQACGSSLDDLPAFLALRQELFELDTRFAQLGDGGIFAALERAGVLSHRVFGVDPIEPAVAEPPAGGRAALRGAAIRRLKGRRVYACGWDRLWDLEGHRILDLADPFATTEQWNDECPRRPHDGMTRSMG